MRRTRPFLLLAMLSACSAAGDPASTTMGPTQTPGGAGSPGTAGNAGSSIIAETGGNAGSAGSGACAEETYGATRVPASVLLLLDRSASMKDCASDAQCTDNKWVSASKAIQGALSSAPPELRVGLAMFPAAAYSGYSDCQSCLTKSMLKGAVPPGCEGVLADCGCHDVPSSPDVPVQELKSTLSSISDKLAASVPDYNTPTYHALESAYQILRALPDQGDLYVLLMTDGDPTVVQPKQKVFVPPMNYYDQPQMYDECLSLQDVVAVADSATKGSPPVRTFVVGSPGVQNTKFLSSLALAGATPKSAGCEASDTCHYQIGSSNFAADLQQVLTTIAGQVATCTFAVPTADKVDPNRVNVSYRVGEGDSQQLYMDPEHQDGWDYTDDSHTKVEIFGPACDAMKKTTESSVTIALGCVTLVK